MPIQIDEILRPLYRPRSVFELEEIAQEAVKDDPKCLARTIVAAWSYQDRARGLLQEEGRCEGALIYFLMAKHLISRDVCTLPDYYKVLKASDRDCISCIAQWIEHDVAQVSLVTQQRFLEWRDANPSQEAKKRGEALTTRKTTKAVRHTEQTTGKISNSAGSEVSQDVQNASWVPEPKGENKKLPSSRDNDHRHSRKVRRDGRENTFPQAAVRWPIARFAAGSSSSTTPPVSQTENATSSKKALSAPNIIISSPSSISFPSLITRSPPSTSSEGPSGRSRLGWLRGRRISEPASRHSPQADAILPKTVPLPVRLRTKSKLWTEQLVTLFRSRGDDSSSSQGISSTSSTSLQTDRLGDRSALSRYDGLPATTLLSPSDMRTAERHDLNAKAQAPLFPLPSNSRLLNPSHVAEAPASTTPARIRAHLPSRINHVPPIISGETPPSLNMPSAPSLASRPSPSSTISAPVSMPVTVVSLPSEMSSPVEGTLYRGYQESFTNSFSIEGSSHLEEVSEHEGEDLQDLSSRDPLG